MSAGLLDTSVVIEGGKTGGARLPDEAAISVMTLAELHVGVLLAKDAGVRARRLALLSDIEREFEPIPVDAPVARRFASIVAEARERGTRPKVVDALIAATAAVHGLPVYTRDRDFEDFAGVAVEVLG